MNKLLTKIVGAALGLTMTVGVGVAVASNQNGFAKAEAAAPSNWVQCSDVTDFAAGDSIIIATNDSSYYFNGATKSGPHWAATALTSSAPASSTADGVIVLGTTGTANKYYLKLAGGTNKDKYVTATKAGSKGSAISASDSSGWTFTKSSTKYFELNYESNNAKFCSYNNQDFRSYASYSSGQQVTIYKYSARSLSSISVSTAPSKTSYTAGEYFDPTGLVITRTYSDSTSDTYAYVGHTSEFTFSPTTSTALATSNTSVTITYGGKSCSQSITVTAPKTPASLSSVGQTTTFDTGDKFAYGGTLTVTYIDSSNKTVTPASFKIGEAGINPTSSGTVITPGTTGLNRNDHNGKTIYVLYSENNTTVYTSYVITVNALSNVTFTAGTDTGTASLLSKSGIEISAASGESDFSRSDNYRVYSGKDVTISSSVGNIAKIEFTCTSDGYNTLTGTGYVKNAALGTWTGDAASVTLTASGGQTRATKIVVTLASNDPVVELDASSATSVSMLKGDANTAVKVFVKNIQTPSWSFKFDEDEQEDLSTSSYISVSQSALVSSVSTLTITTKAVGSTTLKISVSGTACTSTVPVTVAAKPAAGTMVAKHNSTTVSSAVECQVGGHVQFTFEAEDTDGNAYAIHSADLHASIVSGGSYGSLYGSTGVNGTAVGTVVARYELKALSTVYVEVTVNVIDDYNETVNSITFNSNLEDAQGNPVNISEVFATKLADTHFGTTATIADNELLFSYSSDDRANAVSASTFAYDFTHGSTVDATHKLQTVYVYTTFDASYEDSFEITIEQANVALTGIAIANAVNDEIDVARNGSVQLVVSYTPANTTEDRSVTYEVTDGDTGHTISVDSTGLVTVGSAVGKSAIITVTSVARPAISADVQINNVLEAMSITISEPVSWSLVSDPSALVAGDKVILTGVKNEVTYAAGVWAGGNNVPADTEHTLTVSGSNVTGVVDSMIYTLETGSEDDSLAFKGSDGNYLCACSSGNNYMHSQANINGNSSWVLNTDGTVVAQGSYTRNYMRYNNTSTSNMFACYASTGTTGELVTFYKMSGGNRSQTIEADLIQVIENYMSWNESAGRYLINQCDYEHGASFNSTTWNNMGSAFSTLKTKYSLARAVADENGNEVEQFLAAYDYVVGTKKPLGGDWASANDFLGRYSSGGINYELARTTSSASSNNSGIIAISAIITVITLTAIGGYFFLRKRKEQ